MLGTVLAGRYQIRQILGGGGFGQTYIALDTHRPGYPKCVVKHFQPVTHNPEFMETARRLFTSEAETLEKLGHHDQIPRLLAYFEENREFFLVQEFIEGHSLKVEMPPGQPWSESKVILLLQQILDILKFIHLHNVIHRDIKPDNIIRRLQDNKLVLIDFGAVKEVQTQMISPKLTEITVAVGTPGYMSLEQVRGKPRTNSDIYSLGIVAIQALTGLNPRELEDDPHTGEILWQNRTQISPELANILSKMVLNNFKERYQTATEILQVLQQQFTFTSENQNTSISLHLTQPPQISQTQKEPANINNSILSREKYNALENLFSTFVGPIAKTLLRRASSAQTHQELIDNLAIHVVETQKTQFKEAAILLLEKQNYPQPSSQNVQPVINLDIDDRFINQCEQELLGIIGPIARLLVQKTIKSVDITTSREEFIKTLAAEIPDVQLAKQFQQRLIS
ncbi:serine/threonine-protein kinase [Nostoc sp. FACHB-110]|uniref:serine/threonine-protein kinase n=1 Tax=Nostoc sp. FACHB-110 TaxID=2692834 RepID=UPI0016823845|nr:serine/threonine-protein kinase [Nostoc sp. FACHB-110]MBD2439291.1 serine/threonine protein kinase [Nostoc sp. FACHB-110]